MKDTKQSNVEDMRCSYCIENDFDSCSVCEYRVSLNTLLKEIEDRFPEEKEQTNTVLTSFPPQYPKTNSKEYCEGRNDYRREIKSIINNLNK